MRGFVLALGLVAGGAPAAVAQGEPLAPGREARLYVRGLVAPLEGTLVSLDPAQIRIRTVDGELAVGPAQVTRSEVLGSGGNALRGGLFGLGAGLAVGVALVVGSRSDCEPAPSAPCGLPEDRNEAWLLGGPALAGLGTGALVGSLIRTSRWVPAFVPATASPAPGRLGFSWRLPAG